MYIHGINVGFFLLLLRLIEDSPIHHTTGSKASFVRQYSTGPRCNYVKDTRWQCCERSGLQRRTHTMLMATVPSGSCCT